MHVYVLSQIPLPFRLACNTEHGFKCYTTGLCWLSILNIVVCTEWSLFVSKANHSISQITNHAPTSNAEEAEVEQFFEDLKNILELTPIKDVLFIIGDWNAKVGSQETPGVTGKFGLGIWNEAGQRLIEFYQENTLIIANTLFQQHKRRLYTWTSPDGQHQNQIDYILCSQRWRSSKVSRNKQTVAQIMNSLLPNTDLNWRK